ncbi:chitobiase [Vibrio breoganii]|uniref:glycoside hydrolase family 9 protein n=1 Tax=Vibrio breoganii TaxID=553239 RepID=UPI000C851EAC|nr:glycoside hydrolase family 9 protein [Vibrio breoganii]PMG79871.1 chitobiase [Vibrio breoganii]
MQLLINQIGYSTTADKQGVLLSPHPLPIQTVDNADIIIVDTKTHQEVARVPLQPGAQVDQWNIGWCYTFDFSKINKSGTYQARFEGCASHSFEIQPQLLFKRTFSDLLHYFKSQRCSGIYDQADQQATLLGSERTIDVSGGWYDASGDVSKYLSHLSYANYLNPQQIPMLVWNLLSSLDKLKTEPSCHPFTQTRLMDEALFGADFLVRMQDADGFFYMTVFDQWSKDPAQRDICAYKTQAGIKLENYHAGFRQGAGVAIAALASAARLEHCGEFNSEIYLEKAQLGYWHLTEHNQDYLDDGTENIIDEYCALLASVELYKTTHDSRYLDEARQWTQKLNSRQSSDDDCHNFWSANRDGTRPYFHAAEAGLPVITLCCFLDIETDTAIRSQVIDTINASMLFELSITQRVANPFGYPRQYVKDVSGEKRDAFFIAQDNESGYWWQGENARLASLTAMAHFALPYLSAHLIPQVKNYAQQPLNWILGLNPYDMCMLDGHGHNNPDYLPELGFFNAKGGICNGITAAFDNPLGIGFKPEEYADNLEQNWRWGEQWLPHAAWYLLAIAHQTSDELSGDSQ